MKLTDTENQNMERNTSVRRLMQQLVDHNNNQPKPQGDADSPKNCTILLDDTDAVDVWWKAGVQTDADLPPRPVPYMRGRSHTISSPQEARNDLDDTLKAFDDVLEAIEMDSEISSALTVSEIRSGTTSPVRHKESTPVKPTNRTASDADSSSSSSVAAAAASLSPPSLSYAPVAVSSRDPKDQSFGKIRAHTQLPYLDKAQDTEDTHGTSPTTPLPGSTAYCDPSGLGSSQNKAKPFPRVTAVRRMAQNLCSSPSLEELVIDLEQEALEGCDEGVVVVRGELYEGELEDLLAGLRTAIAATPTRTRPTPTRTRPTPTHTRPSPARRANYSAAARRSRSLKSVSLRLPAPPLPSATVSSVAPSPSKPLSCWDRMDALLGVDSEAPAQSQHKYRQEEPLDALLADLTRTEEDSFAAL